MNENRTYSEYEEWKNKTRKDIEEDSGSVLNLSLVPYWFLAILRVVLTLVPQIGYIHPDEYFQTMEVISGDVFNTATTRPWEFNATFPIRSIALPYLVVGFPLLVLKNVAPFISLWFSINALTPYTLLVVPRMACCLLSFVTDVCLYKICYIYGQNYRTRLLTLASSYVLLIYATRTFSNTFEMILSSLLIYLVAKSMARSDRVIWEEEYLKECYNKSGSLRERVRLHRLRLSLPWHSLTNVWGVAGVTALGVWNRPTFLAFALAPIALWLQRGLSASSSLREFHLRAIVLALAAIPPVVGLIVADSAYYGYLTWDEIVTRRISLDNNFVVTPYNFIKYNLNTTNLAEHGLHPRLTHFLLNVPLLYNVLGVTAIFAFCNIIYRLVVQRKWSEVPRVQSIIGLMTASFILPVAMLSLIPHQEPRFLLPCTLPLVFLHSQRIRHQSAAIVQKRDDAGFKVWLKRDGNGDARKGGGLVGTWYLLNMAFALFLGFMHQGGIYPLMEHLNTAMESKPSLTALHIVTSHIYPLPTSLLRLKYKQTAHAPKGQRYQRARDFFAHELGSSLRMESVAERVASQLKECETNWNEKRIKYRLYLVVPSSLMEEFQVEAFKLNMTVGLERVFYPHVSTEALPPLLTTGGPEENPYNPITLTRVQPLSLDFTRPLKYFSQISHQFGLCLFIVKK